MMLDRDGQITPEMIAYFVERVRNNPGMTAVGACAVVPADIADIMIRLTTFIGPTVMGSNNSRNIDMPFHSEVSA
jgi:hypothetical protein